ncbi:MAG: hypothetical protein KDD94_11385 [Calditrichaeota bacterium]|nr:hypothetical protein [Calditrichota bacterium]
MIKSLEFLDHPALKHVSLREVEADHVDFSGAPNTIAIDMFDVSIAWIDIDDLNNLQYLDIDGFSGGEICCIIEGKKGIAPPTNFGHNIGSIYVDGSMFGKFDVDESLFIDKSFDTDSVKLKLPDADAKRILMLHELHILRNDFVLKSEADQLQVIFYGSPEGGNPQEPRKGIIPFGSFSTYRPIESLAALKLLPNIFALYLEGQKFTEIDLSNNPALFAVFIDGCQFFSTIDFTGTQLGAIPGKQSLPFSWGKKGVESPVVIINNFSLSSITFGSQPFLFGLEVRENYNLASMDVQNAPDLNFAYFYDNGLTSINLSGLTSLQYVDLSGNKLTSLNLSGLSALVDAIAAGNQLTSVTLTGTTSLSNLQLENNQIASINLSGLSNLSYVSLGNNSLQPSLDITPISLGLSAVYTSGMNANLDTIYYKAGQDTNYIYHDPHTVLQLAPASKMKGAN